jgi:hypothetical protein
MTRRSRLKGVRTFRIECPHRTFRLSVGVIPQSSTDELGAPEHRVFFISDTPRFRKNLDPDAPSRKFRWKCAECNVDVELTLLNARRILAPRIVHGVPCMDLRKLSRIVSNQ